VKAASTTDELNYIRNTSVVTATSTVELSSVSSAVSLLLRLLRLLLRSVTNSVASVTVNDCTDCNSHHGRLQEGV